MVAVICPIPLVKCVLCESKDCYGLNLKQSHKLVSLTLGLQAAHDAETGPFRGSWLNQNGPLGAGL